MSGCFPAVPNRDQTSTAEDAKSGGQKRPTRTYCLSRFELSCEGEGIHIRLQGHPTPASDHGNNPRRAAGPLEGARRQAFRGHGPHHQGHTRWPNAGTPSSLRGQEVGVVLSFRIVMGNALCDMGFPATNDSWGPRGRARVFELLNFVTLT